jgi:hypothetical protein
LSGLASRKRTAGARAGRGRNAMGVALSYKLVILSESVDRPCSDEFFHPRRPVCEKTLIELVPSMG